MPASWKGAISFGLVTVPVSMAPAVQEHHVPLHQVHETDGGRVRLKRWCELEDKEIPYREIAKGYETDEEHTVVLTNDDLAELPVPTKKTIDVLAFVDQDQIDPVYFAKPYYVSPEKTGAKPYALLRDAMRESGQVAVTKITLSTRESPAVLRVHGDVLVLQVMVWPDEVRDAAGIAPDDAGVRPQELAMARSLIQTLGADFEQVAGDLRDDYHGALRDLVEAKLDGAPPQHQPPRRAAGDNVIDLMAVLERSIQSARGGRSGAGQTDTDADADVDAQPDAGAAGAGSGEGAGTAPRAGKRAAKKAAPRAAAKTPAGASADKPAKNSTAKTNKTAAKKAAPAKSARRRIS